jgi:hypothetical protein
MAFAYTLHEQEPGPAGRLRGVFVHRLRATGLTGRAGRVVVMQARAGSATGNWEPRRVAE